MSDNKYQRFRATCAHILLQVLPQVILKARMLEMLSLASNLLLCLDQTTIQWIEVFATGTSQATFR